LASGHNPGAFFYDLTFEKESECQVYTCEIERDVLLAFPTGKVGICERIFDRRKEK